MPEYVVTVSMGMIFITITLAGIVLKGKGADVRGDDPIPTPVYFTWPQ